MEKTYNVLFLCTGNSARSIIAECLLNRIGRGRFCGYSAGSQPKGEVHPMALHLLKRQNYPIDELRSKNWDEFGAPDAPAMDVVVTVCDGAAGEACPVWPGRPATAHWSFPDPAHYDGTEAEQRAFFEKVYGRIRRVLDALVEQPVETMELNRLQRELNVLARLCPNQNAVD